MADDPVIPAAPEPVAHPSDNVPVETHDAPPLIVAKEPAAEPVEPVTEPVSDPDKSGEPKPPKLPKYAEDLIANSAFEAREAKREAKRLADELAALKKPAEPAPAAPTSADSAAARDAAPAGGYKTQADFDAAVEAASVRREQAATNQRRMNDFNKKSNDTFTAGTTAFGDNFADAVKNLQQVGALPYTDDQGNVYNNEMLEMVLATDKPEQVLYELGSNPDKAASLVGMTAPQRAIEIAKLAVAAPKKAADPLSKAPRPVTPVDGSARTTAAPSDDDDDETFFRKRTAELQAARG